MDYSWLFDAIIALEWVVDSARWVVGSEMLFNSIVETGH